MQNTHYKQAPLPFIGQKRRFLKLFKNVLKHHLNDGQGWTIVDVFGGSGLLSHVAKHTLPHARVIYNDFDNYVEALKNIDDINRLKHVIEQLLVGYTKETRLPKELKSNIIATIKAFDGYKNAHVICSWLLFSGKQIASIDELAKHTMWHNLPAKDYPNTEEYLAGIEVVRESFYTLIPKFINQPKTLLVLDPPYLATNQTAYKKEGYFGIIPFLKLMGLIRPPFVFFSSKQSDFIPYIDFLIEEKGGNWESFKGYEKISIETSQNYQAHYVDNMIYKF